MGNPKLLFALLIASVTVSAALKCLDHKNGENRRVIKTDSRDHLCVQFTFHCALYKDIYSVFCTAEDITANRNLTVARPYRRSRYTALIEDTHCSNDPNERLQTQQRFDVASCDTDLCNDDRSSMTLPTCDKPVDPKFADFYCNRGTWADNSSITESTDREIRYPLRDSYCISYHITEKRTGKDVWRAGYVESSNVLKKRGQYMLKKRGKFSVCKDNVFETDDAIIRSVRICQGSGCNDGNTGDLVTCQNATKAKAAAGEASTISDGRGLLQLLDRNARRVLRVLQTVAGANTTAAGSETNPPSASVSTSTPSPSAQDPSTAAGTPSPSVSVSSSTPSPPAQAPSPKPVTRPPVSAAVSAAQISGIFWVPALIAVVALTSSA